jgi:hypothetical protein
MELPVRSSMNPVVTLLMMCTGQTAVISMDNHAQRLPTEIIAIDMAARCDMPSLVSVSHTNKELYREAQRIIAHKKAALLLKVLPPLLEAFPRPSNLNDFDRFWHKATGTYFLREKHRKRRGCQRIVFAHTDGNRPFVTPIPGTAAHDRALSRSNLPSLNSNDMFSAPPCISFYGHYQQTTQYAYDPRTHTFSKARLYGFLLQ